MTNGFFDMLACNQIATENVSSDGINFTEKQSFVYASYIDDPLASINSNGRFYYHSNAQISISKITDSNQNVVTGYAYNAYGDLQVLQDNNQVDNSYSFTGRQLDKETGLFYFRARYYDANLGQFISRDPIGYVDGMSLYRGYFAVNGLDWSGRDDIRVTGANTVTYMPEGLFGWDLVDQQVALGTVDSDGVVTFNPDLGLREMSLRDLQKHGSNDTIEEVLDAVKKTQDEFAKNNGGTADKSSPAFYADLAVTEKECKSDPLIARRKCERRILARSLRVNVFRGYLLGGGIGVSTLAADRAIYVAMGSGLISGPVGWVGIAGTSIVGFYNSYQTLVDTTNAWFASDKAMERYCKCPSKCSSESKR